MTGGGGGIKTLPLTCLKEFRYKNLLEGREHSPEYHATQLNVAERNRAKPVC